MSVIPFRPRASTKLDAQPVPATERHISGPGYCITCKHEWVAVAPAGTEWLECPSCGSGKGIFKWPCVLPDSAQVFECNCGNQLFKRLRDGWLCPNCGVYCSFPKPGE